MATREAVYQSQNGRCRWPTCQAWMTLETMHAHEVLFRSLGGSALEIANVAGLCADCHRVLHGRIGGVLKRIEAAPFLAEASEVLLAPVPPLRFFERASGDDPWVEVS